MAKYDGNGVFQWARNWGGTLSATNTTAVGTDIAADADGNIYITGYAHARQGDSLDFNIGGNGGVIPVFGTPQGSNSTDDNFVVKYDANGNYVWARIFGGKRGHTRASGIAVDRHGNVAVTGHFIDTLNFDIRDPNSSLLSDGENCRYYPPAWGIPPTCSPKPNLFIAKYDSTGNFIWANKLKTGTASTTYGIEFDRIGNIYVAASFMDTVDFNPNGNGSDTLTASLANVFLLKYDPEGNYLWVKSARGDNSVDEACGLAIHHDGSIHMAGTYQIDINAASTVLDFDNGNAAGQVTNFPRIDAHFGRQDLFLVKYTCSDTSSSSIAAEIACGESYTLGDSVYTAGGFYTQLFLNRAGCDSTVSLELTFIPLNKPVINVDSFTLGVTESYHSYQWLKNGEIIPNATDSTYDVTENADYQIVVTNPSGCIDTSDVYNVNNVSVSELSDIRRQIKVYPNPASAVAHIRAPFKTGVRITDIVGKTVKEQAGDMVISIADWPNGIYLLNITDEHGKLLKVEKLVKKE